MLSRRFLSVFASTAALGALAFLSYPASATVIDDPQIFIQQSGSSPAGGDPNTITNPGSFVVGVAGNFTLQNPLLIIVGVYDGNGTPSITYGGGVSVAPLGTYGLTADTASFTAASVGTAYDQLGLSDGVPRVSSTGRPAIRRTASQRLPALHCMRLRLTRA